MTPLRHVIPVFAGLSSLLVFLVAPGCLGPKGGSGSSTATAFDHATSRVVAARITVLGNGQALPGARVQVLDTIGEPDPTQGQVLEDVTRGNLYLQGLTNGNGVVTGKAKIPTRVETVDVVVNLDGWTGPYTREDLRKEWGDSGPSARITVPAEELGNVRIDLQEEN